jgi:hypothetical protein
MSEQSTIEALKLCGVMLGAATLAVVGFEYLLRVLTRGGKHDA